ncbi:MAG TPA: hypothetical protein VFV34_05470 [Blastocatellia bacterium]|nr:hypothetical protein [Blastocatellia bacterium]
MRKLISITLLLFASGCFNSTASQQKAGRFPISFERDGRKVGTSLTLRIEQNGKRTELEYSPTKPLVFPELTRGKPFNLSVITDKHIFPFGDLPLDALDVAGWRLGIDRRPFHLDYVELKLLKRNMRLVYYSIYQHADGGETPIWFESDKTLDAYHK